MKIGVIGLGAMGGGVVTNLLKSNYIVNVFDIQAEKIESFMLKGAKTTEGYPDLAEKSDVIFTFLPMSPFDPTLEKVVLAENGILNHMKKESIMIDCGNTSPVVAKKIASEAHKRGVYFLDAPVSGGAQGAESATLSIMIGGDKKAFDKCEPILNAIGKRIKYFGDAGMGQLAKLVNNMLVANNLAALSEALVFATKSGIDPHELVEVMNEGAASSWVLKNYGEIILNRAKKGDVTPGGGFTGIKEGGRDKQLSWALQMADELETPLPLTSISQQMFQMARGMGKSGLCEPIIEMLEDLSDTSVLKRNQ